MTGQPGAALNRLATSRQEPAMPERNPPDDVGEHPAPQDDARPDAADPDAAKAGNRRHAHANEPDGEQRLRRNHQVVPAHLPVHDKVCTRHGIWLSDHGQPLLDVTACPEIITAQHRTNRLLRRCTPQHLTPAHQAATKSHPGLASLAKRNTAPLAASAPYPADHQPPPRRANRPRRPHARSDLPRRHHPRRSDPQWDDLELCGSRSRFARAGRTCGPACWVCVCDRDRPTRKELPGPSVVVRHTPKLGTSTTSWMKRCAPI
jgi:hypothetical protein